MYAEYAGCRDLCIGYTRDIQLSRDQRLKRVRRKVSQTKFFEGYEAGENFLIEGRDNCYKC